MYTLKQFDTRTNEITEWLQKEFSSIRTGRATPSLLDNISVESYGAKVSLQQIGSLQIEDARTLRVTPWDTDQIKSVENAILDADLGVSVVVDEKGLRVVFPDLTSERREQLLKLAKVKLEEARVSLRGARDDVIKEIDVLTKKGEMSENERFNTKEELQRHVDETNTKLSGIMEKKEQEISQ